MTAIRVDGGDVSRDVLQAFSNLLKEIRVGKLAQVGEGARAHDAINEPQGSKDNGEVQLTLDRCPATGYGRVRPQAKCPRRTTAPPNGHPASQIPCR